MTSSLSPDRLNPFRRGVGSGCRRAALLALAVAGLFGAASARADSSQGNKPEGYLDRIHHHSLLGSTVPENGDQNPYAVVVSPVSAGRIAKDDVLVTNFNNSGNLQGLGTTIVDYRPSAKSFTQFAALPRHLAQCPGGIGLTTAMAVLRSGYVVVGSLPSQDGTTGTKGKGCLVVLDGQGQVAGTLTSANIDGPWGNMAVIDHGDHASLFVSNTGVGVQAPGQDPVKRANILRLDLATPAGQPPHLLKETVIGDGFAEQADADVFIIGPTGLALDKDNTLFVSDAIGNRIAAIPDAATRTGSAGTGREVTKDGLLKRPLAMARTPDGDLLVVNGQNGQVVELDPHSGRQIYAQWIDPNRAQNPPGSGDLFGLAMTPSGDGFYYVEDEVNSLMLAH